MTLPAPAPSTSMLVDQHTLIAKPFTTPNTTITTSTSNTSNPFVYNTQPVTGTTPTTTYYSYPTTNITPTTTENKVTPSNGTLSAVSVLDTSFKSKLDSVIGAPLTTKNPVGYYSNPNPTYYTSAYYTQYAQPTATYQTNTTTQAAIYPTTQSVATGQPTISQTQPLIYQTANTTVQQLQAFFPILTSNTQQAPQIVQSGQTAISAQPIVYQNIPTSTTIQPTIPIQIAPTDIQYTQQVYQIPVQTTTGVQPPPQEPPQGSTLNQPHNQQIS